MHKPQRQSSKTKPLLEEESEQSVKISNGRVTYQIGSEIGRGGFGIVFQALNVQTGDFVAVKRFPLKAIEDESLSSIESEIELMQKLNHPNIVKYIDTIRTKDYLHIVLEYMENGSLSNVIKKFGAFSESLTAIYITQVLRGLKYLHEQGVLHRDIKGANILTTKDGMVKLADFGVAIKLSEAHENDQNVVGSPYWIAPEIIEMSAPTSACDIWSVGCIIIELLTKKPPYYDLPPMAALFRIVQDDYPPLPEGISQALRDFLLACFQKEPAMRSSAAKLLEHPWLYNSSTNPNLAQTSKMLESKANSTAAAANSSEVEQSTAAAADSIVNTIRKHQLQAPPSHPPSLHSQSVDPAALARRNLSRKTGNSLELGGSSSGAGGGNSKNPRTPTKKLAAESFDFVKSSTSSSGGGGGQPLPPGMVRSDSKPPLKTRLIRNATVNARPSMPLMRSEEDIIRKVASLDSPHIKIVGGNMIPLIPTDRSGAFSKSSPDNKARFSPSPASQSKSPLDESNLRVQRSRSGSGSVYSDKEYLQRKDSFVLSDISAHSQGNHSTDVSDELKGSDLDVMNKSSMYAAGMTKITDSSDEDWDLELRENAGIVPASEDSMDRLLQIPREKGGLVIRTLSQSTPKGTPKNTPKHTSVAGFNSKSATPKHGGHAPLLLDQRSLSAVLNQPIEEEEETEEPSKKLVSGAGPTHLQRTHATVTAEALQSVERSGVEDSPKRKPMPRNPAVIADQQQQQQLQQQPRRPSLSTVNSGRAASIGTLGTVNSISSAFLLPNASSLSNNEKIPSFVVNQSQQMSFLAKYKEPEEENYDDLIRKSTSEEAAAYAGTFVEADDESINDDDFDDGEDGQVIDNTQLHQKIKSYSAFHHQHSQGGGGLHAALSSTKGRALTRSRSLPLASTSRSEFKLSPSLDDMDSFGDFGDDDEDELEEEDDEEGEDDQDDDGFSMSDARATINPFDMKEKLRQRMKESVQEVVEEESDEFINYQFDDKDFKENERKDVHFRRSREVVDIMAKIRTETAESEVIEYCTQLMSIFTNFPEQRDHLVTYHGVMPIIDMIEARSYSENKYGGTGGGGDGGGGVGAGGGGMSSSSRRRKTLRPFVLRVINKIIEGSTRAQEQLSLVGIIPTVMNIFDRSHRSDYSQILTPAHHHYSAETPMTKKGSNNSSYLNSINAQYHQNWHQQVDPVTLEAARFIHQISSTSSLTLQMLIGAGGLSVLTNMVSFGAHILPLTPTNFNSTKRFSGVYASSPRTGNSRQSSGEGVNFQSPLGTSEAASSLSSSSNNLRGGGGGGGAGEKTKKTSFLSYSEDKEELDTNMTIVLSQFSGESVDGTVDSSTPGVLNRHTSNESLLGSQFLGNTGINESDDSAASMQIFQMGIDCIAHVFAVQSSRTRDFCRLFVKLGLLPHLSVAFQNILSLFLARMNSGGPMATLTTNNSGNNLPSAAAVTSAAAATPAITDSGLNSPRKQPLTIPRLTELGIASPASLNMSRSNSGNAPSEAASALRDQNLLRAPLSAREGGSGLKHHRKGSSSTDSGTLHALGQETLEESPERKYTQEIATLFFKFSRSDSVVAEMMANCDYGVVTVILTALKAPELRTVEFATGSGGHSQSGSQHSLDGSNHGRHSHSGSGSSSALLANFPQLNLTPLLIASTGTTDQPLKRRSISLAANNLHPTYVEIVELLLKCLKNLSMEPGTLADLEKAGVMETLIPLLAGPISDKCRNHILPCVFNICRINKKRQETAAALGIIPHLKKVITDGSPMRQFALPILFDLAHTSTATRAELWKHDCVSFYLNQLKDNYWQTFALNSLAIWLSHDTSNVGKHLIEPAQLNKLIDFFCASSVQRIQTLHKSLLDMMQKSKELCRALSGSSQCVTALINFLKTTSEAIVLRSLLKMLQLLHHYHLNPMQFVAEYDLFNLVKDFAQSEGQVLVCQIAEKLLVDFQMSSSMASSSTDSSHTLYSVH